MLCGSAGVTGQGSTVGSVRVPLSAFSLACRPHALATAFSTALTKEDLCDFLVGHLHKVGTTVEAFTVAFAETAFAFSLALGFIIVSVSYIRLIFVLPTKLTRQTFGSTFTSE